MWMLGSCAALVVEAVIVGHVHVHLCGADPLQSGNVVPAARKLRAMFMRGDYASFISCGRSSRRPSELVGVAYDLLASSQISQVNLFLRFDSSILGLFLAPQSLFTRSASDPPSALFASHQGGFIIHRVYESPSALFAFPSRRLHHPLSRRASFSLERRHYLSDRLFFHFEYDSS